MSRNPRFAAPPQGANFAEEVGSPREMRMQEFSRRLKKARLSKGWNQADLARQAELGRDAISKYEGQRALPEPSSVEKLAKALGVLVEDLYPGSLELATKEEIPAVELREIAGHPGKAWLRINRAVSFGTAARIVALIEDDRQAEAQSKLPTAKRD